MTVEELIDWLSNFPKDKTVYIPYGECGGIIPVTWTHEDDLGNPVLDVM